MREMLLAVALFLPSPQILLSPEIAGARMSSQEAAEVEKRIESNPDSLDDRARILGYYSLHVEMNSANRRTHVLWVIEHHPESSLAGSPEASLFPLIDRDAYEIGKQLWLKVTTEQASDAVVVRNAAQYFFNADRKLAEQMLLKGKALEPSASRWSEQLGQLYLLSRRYPDQSNPIDRPLPEIGTLAVQEYERALTLAKASERSRVLSSLADAALEMNMTDRAAVVAKQAIATGNQDGIHQGNSILGRIALLQGDVEASKTYLIASGKVSGSPVLGSFGPGMRLANDLLQRGEREAVLAYLEECRTFWSSGQAKLSGWIDSIKKGATPTLGNSGR